MPTAYQISRKQFEAVRQSQNMRWNGDEGGSLQYVLLACLIILIAISPLLLDYQPLLEKDETAFYYIYGLGVPGHMTDFLTVFTELGSLYFIIIFSLILWVGGHPRLGAGILLAMLVTILIGYSMKTLIDRPRPYEVLSGVEALSSAVSESFPSGHTLGAFTVTGVFIMRCKRWAPVVLVFAVAIGVSRIMLGLHFPFDVLMGAVLGLNIGILVGGLDIDRRLYDEE